MGTKCSCLYNKENTKNIITGINVTKDQIIEENKLKDNNLNASSNKSLKKLDDSRVNTIDNNSDSIHKKYFSFDNSIVNNAKIKLINRHIRGFLYRLKFNKYILNDLKLFTENLYKNFMTRNENINVSNILDSEDEQIKEYLNTPWSEFYSEDPNRDILNRIHNVVRYKGYIKFKYSSKSFHSDDMEEILRNALSAYKGEVNLITNKKLGSGILTYNNGATEIGFYVNDIFTGWNIYVNENGTLFLGLFINNNINGKGIRYQINDDHLYKGDFVNNLRHGYGIDQRIGSKYTGEFLNDRKCGKGKLEFENGDFYEGNFENNKFSGEGKYVWEKKKHEYNGEYKDGMFNGKGLYKWNGNEYYKGEFKNGIKEGLGEIGFPDGRVFQANFVNGKAEGKAKYINENGIEEEVEFINGKLNSKI